MPDDLANRWQKRLGIGLGSVVLLALSVASGRWWSLPLTPSPATGKFDTGYQSVQWQYIDDLHLPLAQYNSVFWEPLDTVSLREQIFGTRLVEGKRVLEIGTGSGLLAVCCLLAGAERVVATDVNPLAVANARHNADRFQVLDRLDARLVPLERSAAFSVVRPDERFDFIVSNPPWEDDQPQSIADFALYDPGFQLLRSILQDGQAHLRPGGRMWLAYGCVSAIKIIERLGPTYGWKVVRLDNRKLEELSEVFLPGMLLELTPR